MAVRAQWKGFLVFGEVTCPVSLYTATSTAERVTFNTLNRATGNRVRREFVDVETGKLVEREAQVKGYEVGDTQYVILTPEDVAAAVPDRVIQASSAASESQIFRFLTSLVNETVCQVPFMNARVPTWSGRRMIRT